MPDTFISSRKRRLIEEAQQRNNAELAREAQLEMDYDDYRRAETERFIKESLLAGEFQSLFDKIRQQMRLVYKQMTPAQLDDVTRASVAYDFSGRIPLLSFEKFRKERLAAV